jgi:hypothetical protein
LKIAIVCESVLLSRSLEIFLKDSDVVLADREFECEKPILLVSSRPKADIRKPFGKTKLYAILENYEKDQKAKKMIFEPQDTQSGSQDDLDIQIEKLVQDFSKKLIRTIKEHYNVN